MELSRVPGASEAALIKLLDVCSVASYGHKGKDVIDKTYRNAFKLEPDNFTTSFQIYSIPILQKIQSILPTVIGLKAELYKLNICDWICENVHSSRIHFFNFEDS